MRRIRWTTLVVLIALASALACSDKGDGPTQPPPPLPATISLQFITGGFTSPVFMTQPPGDNSRMFVVQKSGEIMVVKNGNRTSFLDITGFLSTGDERGLLSMAFDPGYAGNGRFYVCYTGADGDVIVERYHVSANPDSAVPTPDEIVLRVEHSSDARHNGGLILFGPDDKLYVGIGDAGGDGGDPLHTGQNPGDSLANILRIDVSGDSGYVIPPDNPFAASPVWSWGLRNPWRFSFDRTTDDLYIGDVGQDNYEEVDVATAATGGGRNVNFGWPMYEGSSCFLGPCSPAGKTMPVHDYVHVYGNLSNSAFCIIGGYVYRGSAMVGLDGHYFYGDNGGTWLRSFKFSGGTATEHTLWNVALPHPALSFAEDNQGELYVLTSGGDIFRIAP